MGCGVSTGDFSSAQLAAACGAACGGVAGPSTTYSGTCSGAICPEGFNELSPEKCYMLAY